MDLKSNQSRFESETAHHSPCRFAFHTRLFANGNREDSLFLTLAFLVKLEPCSRRRKSLNLQASTSSVPCKLKTLYVDAPPFELNTKWTVNYHHQLGRRVDLCLRNTPIRNGDGKGLFTLQQFKAKSIVNRAKGPSGERKEPEAHSRIPDAAQTLQEPFASPRWAHWHADHRLGHEDGDINRKENINGTRLFSNSKTAIQGF